MPVTPKRKSKSGRKGGGFFGCRSKSALDSLPRNARGNGAAIHRLQAQHVFEDDSVKPSSCNSPSPTTWNNANPFELVNVKVEPALHAEDTVDDDEARDVLTDSVNPALNSSSPGVVRVNSISGTGGLFRRSLSLKRSGSTATANLVQRAPPVSSTDFAPGDQPSTSSQAADGLNIDHGPSHLKGDMASIRQARGQHLSASAAAASSQTLFPDICEDEYINLAEVPVPPSFIPVPSLPPVSSTATEPEASAKRTSNQLQHSAASAMPESESMRAVALVLGDETIAPTQGGNLIYRFQPGPAINTPRLECSSPATIASIAELDSRRSNRGSDMDGDELAPLPESAPAASGGFWDNHTDKETCAGGPNNTKFVPFQYMTNLSRPVSIASFRSLASPHTPPRTSSRNAIQNRPSFSPLASQGTFNGFPAGYFPKASAPIRPSAGSSPIEQKDSSADTSMEDVEAQLGLSNPPGDEFAQFAAKGKASRRTTIKKTSNATGMPLTDTTNTGEPSTRSPLLLSASPQKKMVPGPAGNYITDTANMRWCSALDEIKKALASTTEDSPEADLAVNQSDNKFDRLENHIDELLEEADAVLMKLGVETHP